MEGTSHSTGCVKTHALWLVVRVVVVIDVVVAAVVVGFNKDKWT